MDNVPHQGKKWVIVFLIYADFRTDHAFPMNDEMKAELDLLFEEVLTTRINSQFARLFIILNSIKFTIESQRALKVINKTLLYQVTNAGKLGKNRIQSCQIIKDVVHNPTDIGPNVVQKVEQLKHVLDHIAVDTEEEVFFITWDHGSAFGIFRNSNAKPPATVLRTIYDELHLYPYLNEFWRHAMNLSSEQLLTKGGSNADRLPLIQSGTKLFKFVSRHDDRSVIVSRYLSEEVLRDSIIENITSDRFKLVLRKEGNKLNEINIASDFSVGGNDVAFLLEEVPTEILKNHELSEALTFWLKGKKVSVLLMMNCWMMNLHTMYTLKSSVHCLVAPQGDIAIPGYNYKDILKLIYRQKKTFVSKEDLARECVNLSENKYALKRAKIIYKRIGNSNHAKIDSWKIAAVDLQKMDLDGKDLFVKQIDAFKIIVTHLNAIIGEENSTESKRLFRYVRSLSFEFTGNKSMMVDIVNWCISVKNVDDKLGILPNVLFNKILDFLDLVVRRKEYPKLIIAMSKGDSIYKVNSISLPQSVIGLPPTGYSLFFPLRMKDIYDENLEDNYKSDLLLRNVLENWVRFIEKGIL